MRTSPLLVLALATACSRSNGQVQPDPVTTPAPPKLPVWADGTLATSTSEAPLPDSGVKVFIGRKGLSLDPAGPPLLKTGSDPSAGYPKEDSKNALQLAPLANALPSGSRALVYVDRGATYRMLIEVLFTLGQKKFEEMVLVAKNGAREVAITLTLPKPGGAFVTTPHLSIILVGSAFAVKTSLGNLKPGCTDIGPGLAVPERDGKPDVAGLRACVHGVKALVDAGPWDDTVTFAANSDRTFQELVDALDAVRPDFPKVALAVFR